MECHELHLPGKSLTWDLDGEGDWGGNLKGVDDYLLDLINKENKKQKSKNREDYNKGILE